MMCDTQQKKRIKVQLKCPNPLFETWLEQWLQESRECDSKLQYCYSKALSALKKYPLPLDSGADCRILEGFGQKLCSMLDRKLVLHKQTETDLNKPTYPKRPKMCKSTDYLPELNSGPYALVIASYKATTKEDYKGFLLKQELIKLAQPLSEKSFTKCDPGSYYNAWSSMKTLIEKELVIKRGNPAKYSLTNRGISLGINMYNHLKENSNNEESTMVSKNDIDVNRTCTTTNNRQNGENGVSYKGPINIKPLSSMENEFNIHVVPSCSYVNIHTQKQRELLPKSNSMSSTTSITSTDTILDEFIFAPSSFDVILLVDTNETNGSANITNDPLLSDLSSSSDVKFEVRNLKVGDFTWIARNESNKELVLPYIIERKRADDLAKSIKDGRFHEQKFRLKQCGIQNLIYLIESHGNNQHTGLPLSTLLQASVNTLVQDRFQLKYTDHMRETVNYLVGVTRIINELFKGKTLMSCMKQDLIHCTPMETLVPLMTFADFNKAAAKNKNLKIKQLFVRQLLQLKGLSLDKALKIVDIYPTPLDLHLAYKTCAAKERELLLSNIRFGDQKKPIGATISKTIFLFFTSLKYN